MTDKTAPEGREIEKEEKIRWQYPGFWQCVIKTSPAGFVAGILLSILGALVGMQIVPTKVFMDHISVAKGILIGGQLGYTLGVGCGIGIYLLTKSFPFAWIITVTASYLEFILLTYMVAWAVYQHIYSTELFCIGLLCFLLLPSLASNLSFWAYIKVTHRI